jgi:imidazole glycerol-phosphate synthase subunit HisF
MAVKRIIARMDIKGPHLVKGIHLEGLRVLGQPESFAKHYYEQGADELMYMDVVASLYERNSLSDIITRTAKQSFIPLTVGGGLRTIADINSVLRAGADKVCINTAGINQPDFIKQASKKFGASTIVVAIEAIQQPDGSYLCYTDNGREHTGVEAIAWAKKVEELGAGELVITSVDNEGTGSGFNESLTNLVSDAVSIPVIAHGGAGSIHHINAVFANTNCDAVALASILHYKALEDVAAAQQDNQGVGNIDFLSSGRKNKAIKEASIKEIKNYLATQHISVRD